MNAVEIEQAVSELAEGPFDPEEFPFAFLRAFGSKDTTIQRLRRGDSNKSDIGGVLQVNNIHLCIAAKSEVTKVLEGLRASPATTKAKAKFILATDGETLEAEDLTSGDTVACSYSDFPNHFGFFLPLAGISTVRQITENAFDIRATSRLNRLYVELLKTNPEWGTEARRPDMNHFMARLIFCFFAEDTDIFRRGPKGPIFTTTVEMMSARDSSDTHEVISKIFLAMNTKEDARTDVGLPRWANDFPYVNGGLFSGSTEVPRFSKLARSYLMHIGGLDWKRINPDIFGSMIQAVADDDERGALGMHYTSVPNILKVLNPLFLDDLRKQLEEAGGNARSLLNLRNRMSKIRVFDPACGSGNFLVIAYKEMRAIEAEINKRRNEADRASEIPLTNYRGIELRDFPCEIARLALIIAEYQCDVLYRGNKLALTEFLPLEANNWITCGNALRLDWMSICPPTGTGVSLHADDLFETPLDQPEIDFENEGGETYICSNPPYLGSTWQSASQKADLKAVFVERVKNWKSLDYVAGWFIKCADFCQRTKSEAALVSTNSICQGQQVPIIWPSIYATGCGISFAHTSFKWANLAAKKAGVTVVVVGLAAKRNVPCRLYAIDDEGRTVTRQCRHINAYLIAADDLIVEKHSKPMGAQGEMSFGNKAVDGGKLLLSKTEVESLGLNIAQEKRFIRKIYGSAELIRGLIRFCLWIEDKDLDAALMVPAIRERTEAVHALRLASSDSGAREMAAKSHQFREMNFGKALTIAMPRTSSESRHYLPAGLLSKFDRVTSEAFAIYDGELWNFGILTSRLHLVWIATVCGKLKTDYRYSNTIGWNTFPIPALTEKNKIDLARCAENILLAREAHYPATIADLYDPEAMPANLREAHEQNDAVLERIYIGRSFRNDTERLEKLFELYTKMTLKTAGRVRGDA